MHVSQKGQDFALPIFVYEQLYLCIKVRNTTYIENIALDIFQQVFFLVYTHFRESIAPKYKQHTSLLSYLETLLVVQFFIQLFYMQEYFLCSLQAISVFVTRYFTSKNGQKKTSLFYQNIFYEVVVPNAWHFGVVKYIPTTANRDS